MREVLPVLLAAYARGEPVALATLVRTWSHPRGPGLLAAGHRAGRVVGTVSGGCVEGDLYEVGLQVLATGEPVVATYGVSDDDAFAAGLTCGGSLEAFVQRVSPESWPELPSVAASIQSGEPVAVATVVRGPAHVGRPWWCATARSRARSVIAASMRPWAPRCSGCPWPGIRAGSPSLPRASGRICVRGVRRLVRAAAAPRGLRRDRRGRRALPRGAPSGLPHHGGGRATGVRHA